MADRDYIWHAPQPGPLYWDWQCLRCDQPVADHAPLWRRLRARLMFRLRGSDG